MTLTINLPPATLEKLQAQAAASGKDIDTFVREAVEAKLADKKRSFLEILKPLHDEVQESGMTEEELDALIVQEIDAVRAEKRSRAAL